MGACLLPVAVDRARRSFRNSLRDKGLPVWRLASYFLPASDPAVEEEEEEEGPQQRCIPFPCHQGTTEDIGAA